MGLDTPLHLFMVSVKFINQSEEMYVTNTGAYATFGPETRVFLDEELAEETVNRITRTLGDMASSVTKYTFSQISTVTRQVPPKNKGTAPTESSKLDVKQPTKHISPETIAKRRS